MPLIINFMLPNIVFNHVLFLVSFWLTVILANQMDKLQDLSQSELQELLDNPERVDSMALESDEVMSLLFKNSISPQQLQTGHFQLN